MYKHWHVSHMHAAIGKLHAWLMLTQSMLCMGVYRGMLHEKSALYEIEFGIIFWLEAIL